MEFIKIEPKAKKQKPAQSESKQPQTRPLLIRVSEVEEKPITWLWENKIPCGMLSLITGLGGIGKSFWTVYMSSVITNGWDWADGKPCEKGSVLFFYGEEGIGDTYKKRFRANGADDSKIMFLNGAEQIEGKQRFEVDVTLENISIIESAIQESTETTGLPVKMVVIDPISNYWGDIKENSNAEVRSVLKPLQHLAEKTGVAFVLIQHTGKGDKEHAQQKVLGSTGIVAACRSVWGVYHNPDEAKQRLFVPVKTNCCVDPTAVSYGIAPPDGTVQIIETGIAKTGDDIESAKRGTQGRKPTELADAETWLQDILSEGEKLQTEIMADGKAEGFSERTLQRAKKALGIKSVRENKTDPWRWGLPADSDVFSDCQNAD